MLDKQFFMFNEKYNFFYFLKLIIKIILIIKLYLDQTAKKMVIHELQDRKKEKIV